VHVISTLTHFGGEKRRLSSLEHLRIGKQMSLENFKINRQLPKKPAALKMTKLRLEGKHFGRLNFIIGD
jgi:hypothetical protein